MKSALVPGHRGLERLGMLCSSWPRSGYHAASSDIPATDFACMDADWTGLPVVLGARQTYADEDSPLRYRGCSPVLHRPGEGLD